MLPKAGANVIIYTCKRCKREQSTTNPLVDMRCELVKEILAVMEDVVFLEFVEREQIAQ